jgi:hypothetical protein
MSGEITALRQDHARADEKRRLETAIAAAVREINALPVEYDVAVTEAIAAAVREINALPVEYDVAVTEDGCRGSRSGRRGRPSHARLAPRHARKAQRRRELFG